MNVARVINSKALIHLEEWGVWVFWIFGVCLITILVTPLFSDLTVTYSSLLAYCFTLMAVNVYLFDHQVTIGVEEAFCLEKLRKYLGMGIMIGSVICFIIYNLDEGVNKTLNDHITLTVLTTAVPVFFVALSLNTNMISRQAKR